MTVESVVGQRMRFMCTRCWTQAFQYSGDPCMGCSLDIVNRRGETDGWLDCDRRLWGLEEMEGGAGGLYLHGKGARASSGE